MTGGKKKWRDGRHSEVRETGCLHWEKKQDKKLKLGQKTDVLY